MNLHGVPGRAIALGLRERLLNGPHRLAKPQHPIPQLGGKQGRQLARTAVEQELLRVITLGGGALAPEHMQQRHLLRLSWAQEAHRPAEVGEVPRGEWCVGVGVDPVLEAAAIELSGGGMVVGVAFRQLGHQCLELLQGRHGVVPVGAGNGGGLALGEALEKAGEGAAAPAEHQHRLAGMGGLEAADAVAIQEVQKTGLAGADPLAAQVDPGLAASLPLQTLTSHPTSHRGGCLDQAYGVPRQLQGAGRHQTGEATAHHHGIDGFNRDDSHAPSIARGVDWIANASASRLSTSASHPSVSRDNLVAPHT